MNFICSECRRGSCVTCKGYLHCDCQHRKRLMKRKTLVWLIATFGVSYDWHTHSLYANKLGLLLARWAAR